MRLAWRKIHSNEHDLMASDYVHWLVIDESQQIFLGLRHSPCQLPDEFE